MQNVASFLGTFLIPCCQTLQCWQILLVTNLTAKDTLCQEDGRCKAEAAISRFPFQDSQQQPVKEHTKEHFSLLSAASVSLLRGGEPSSLASAVFYIAIKQLNILLPVSIVFPDSDSRMGP